MLFPQGSLHCCFLFLYILIAWGSERLLEARNDFALDYRVGVYLQLDIRPVAFVPVRVKSNKRALAVGHTEGRGFYMHVCGLVAFGIVLFARVKADTRVFAILY